MKPIAEPDWSQAYGESAVRLRRVAAKSRLILSGFCACMDWLVTLDEAAPVLLASPDPDAVLLGQELLRRAESGAGGELLSQSVDAPSLAESLGGRTSLGGTAAQAAYALAQLGAPVLMALQDRTREQIALLHPDILIATEHGLIRAGVLPPQHQHGRGKAPHIIVEYVRDRAVAGIVPPRSTRVIVRFADDGMDRDPYFASASQNLAGDAASAILAGFNAIPADELDATLAEAGGIARSWRDAGLAMIHLELGDFPNRSHRQSVIGGLTGRFTSLGMNYNELRSLLPGPDSVRTKARYLAETLGVQRVAIHADDWALTVTRGDPWREQQALLAGCLLAASRAAHGQPIVPDSPPQGASFRLPHPAFTEEDGWYAVSCPAPWLPRPTSTIGLGDTFVAGTMLMLGRAKDEHGSPLADVPAAMPERR